MNQKRYFDQPSVYTITVQGALDASWMDYFDNMKFQPGQAKDGSPTTTLSGTLADQAAVQGVLQKLYNLGFPLISVVREDSALLD